MPSVITLELSGSAAQHKGWGVTLPHGVPGTHIRIRYEFLK